MRWLRAINAGALPDQALLARYREQGAYTDCYRLDYPDAVSHESFVNCFYTTWLFRLERLILKWAVARPSTDAEAAQLAAGTLDEFAAWQVEARTGNQLLLCDFQGRTRSWLMVTPSPGGVPTAGTRLYFGSAVVPLGADGSRRRAGGTIYRLLLGLHKAYSVALLGAAASRLGARRS